MDGLLAVVSAFDFAALYLLLAAMSVALASAKRATFTPAKDYERLGSLLDRPDLTPRPKAAPTARRLVTFFSVIVLVAIGLLFLRMSRIDMSPDDADELPPDELDYSPPSPPPPPAAARLHSQQHGGSRFRPPKG